MRKIVNIPHDVEFRCEATIRQIVIEGQPIQRECCCFTIYPSPQYQIIDSEVMHLITNFSGNCAVCSHPKSDHYVTDKQMEKDEKFRMEHVQ